MATKRGGGAIGPFQTDPSSHENLCRSQAVRLREPFYRRPTLDLAQALLGTFLVHHTAEGTTIGRIVETEAYLHDDPACHASRGLTERTRVIFGKAGHAYIYFIYGKYFCFNVVSGQEGCGEAVLIRALEPVAGISLMQQRRGTEGIKDLCSGPAKLVIAMGIEKSYNGLDLGSEQMHILAANSLPESFPVVVQQTITTTTRIGISKGQELAYRYYLSGNPFISKK